MAIVPARLGSTRLPRKMLLRETGRHLFEHTVANVSAAGVFERVVLATDAPEIEEAARAAGIPVVLTSPAHQSGTDRVCEALGLLRRAGDGPWAVVVNVQGDEPELPAKGLAALVALFTDPAVEAATLASRIDSPTEARDPNVVKVVLDHTGDALYFSRAAIPRAREGTTREADWLRHLGVYAFRPAALERFRGLAPGSLERTEGLEQLRWLEAGGKMRCIVVAPHPPGIDTREQYEAFENRVRNRLSLEQKRS